MKTRLQDIAESVGVSVSTVSRVVNGKPGVAEDTRRAVLAELELLGYEHPAGEARGQTGLVGLLVPELANPIFPRFVQELERALVAGGYTPLVCTATPLLQEDEYITMLLDREIDGMIFVSGRHANTEVDHDRYEKLVAEGFPMVFVGGQVPGLDAPFVSADEDGGFAFAVRHLANSGHRRIGCIMGPSRYVSSQRKVDGFVRGLQAVDVDGGGAGGPSAQHIRDRYVAHSVYSIEGGQAAAQVLLDRGATGLVCGSDMMALGAVRAARDRGLQVPRDLSVVGYDDAPLMAFTDPPLTTLRQDVAAMSRAAVGLLMDEMRGTPHPRGELVFRTELVVRDSTGPPGV